MLEGEFRPTHFRGVATIVLKLFQLAPADRAYFGRKDYQQTLVVRQMVADLNVPIDVRVCPTVREPDGLAMSSRNAYLSPDERRRAVALSRSLRLAEQLAREGERNVETIRQQMLREIEQRRRRRHSIHRLRRRRHADAGRTNRRPNNHRPRRHRRQNTTDRQHAGDWSSRVATDFALTPLSPPTPVPSSPMCSELFRIPYAWGGVPIFGIGVLLAIWAIASRGHARQPRAAARLERRDAELAAGVAAASARPSCSCRASFPTACPFAATA